jgi:hypothetical protein
MHPVVFDTSAVGFPAAGTYASDRLGLAHSKKLPQCRPRGAPAWPQCEDMNPIGGAAASVWSDYDYSDEALNGWACMPGCSLPTGTIAETSGDTPLFIVAAASGAIVVTFVLPFVLSFGMTFGLTLAVAFGSTFAATFGLPFAVTVDAAPGGAAAANMIAIATTALRGGRG